MLSLEGNKAQYLHRATDSSTINPDAYNMDSYFLERKGRKGIQVALFKNYGTNFPKYPEWQAYFRQHQPRALILWGKNDPIFILNGAYAYKKDLNNTELHELNGGHFTLEEHHKIIANYIDRFLAKEIKSH